jgi:hypothetical protein
MSTDHPSCQNFERLADLLDDFTLVAGVLFSRCLHRSNFPSDGIRDMARAALEGGAHRIEQAARANRRTAHSATAGTAPVPSHIAYFGGAVALGRAAVPYRPVGMAGVDQASAKSARLSIR